MRALAVRAFVGGEPVPALSPLDRGLAYGDGLFETMRLHAGQPVWWEAHVARLAAGCRRLGLPMPDAGWLRGQLQALCAQAPQAGVARLTLTRGEGDRGYAPPEQPAPGMVLSLHPSPPAPPADGLNLRWCHTRLALQPALAGLKHLNRLEQVLARREWNDPDVHEGLMLDGDGLVVCATAANLFAYVDGEWLTPPVDRCGVAGVCRGWLLAAGLAREARLRPETVEAAAALFLCNAVRGILPVRRLESRDWSAHPAVWAVRERLGREVPAFLERGPV
ncbi:aminodeoxychorismate lyase [Arenimonas fontis]|uniref:Aminodeoxychorismate lyase n=1 Tax=Arenimonas fontis TaxID=2608255 RepID=A0A5B2ZEW2_9GAMM|nr:aminodeoxychorismate lyase [Arenimonas fontis]KAA2285622.1 aminodeoxychorismate lyase [Arenimonas fontis]